MQTTVNSFSALSTLLSTRAPAAPKPEATNNSGVERQHPPTDFLKASVTFSQVDESFTLPIYFSLGLCIFSTTTSTGSTGASQDVSMLYA